MLDPHQLIALPEIDSTNAEVMRRAKEGATGPLWIMAERQTAGRGRLGRQWASEPGNLHASLLIDLACGAEAASRLSLVAGVAVIDAIHALPQAPRLPLRLKWPNDILLGARKTGGILIETSSFGPERGLAAVIGIGLNVSRAPQAAPEATCLAAHGATVTPREMLDRLASAMQSWLGVWDQGAGFETIRQAWLDRAGKAEEKISVNSGAGFVAGRFAGLDADGALLMDDGGGRRRRFTFGDVTLGPG